MVPPHYYYHYTLLRKDEQDSWSANTADRDLFKAEIKTLISTENGFKAFEKLTNFHILHKDFEPGNEMTQTMKVRRPIVQDLYEKEIAAMFR